MTETETSLSAHFSRLAKFSASRWGYILAGALASLPLIIPKHDRELVRAAHRLETIDHQAQKSNYRILFSIRDERLIKIMKSEPAQHPLLVAYIQGVLERVTVNQSDSHQP